MITRNSKVEVTKKRYKMVDIGEQGYVKKIVSGVYVVVLKCGDKAGFLRDEIKEVT